MLSQTQIDQKFSALKEHGEEVATHFKEFVQKLDGLLPDGVSKLQFVNMLEAASGWAHNALSSAEQTAQNLSHQRAKSGSKTPDETAAAQGTAPDPALTNVLDTKTPVKDPAPES